MLQVDAAWTVRPVSGTRSWAIVKDGRHNISGTNNSNSDSDSDNLFSIDPPIDEMTFYYLYGAWL